MINPEGGGRFTGGALFNDVVEPEVAIIDEEGAVGTLAGGGRKNDGFVAGVVADDAEDCG